MTGALVIGSGVAGTAAAFALHGRGIEVTLLLGAPGASQLGPGTLSDGRSAGTASGHPVDSATAAFVDDLGAFRLGETLVPTLAGEIMSAQGADRALLDLAPLDGGLVLVPRMGRLDWNGDLIAWMLSAHPIAAARGLSFRPVDAALLRLAAERFEPDAVLAARHDDPARLEWLTQRLSHASASAQAEGGKAWLLPPWLGAERERATQLSRALSMPCGEIAVGLSGPSGFRFQHARDRILSRDGITSRAGFATRVVEEKSRVTTLLEDGDTIVSDVVVICTGGLVGGGLVYEPSEVGLSGELPLQARPYLRATLGDFTVGVRGAPLDLPGSLFGVAPELLAWPWTAHGDLERAGVLVEEGGRVRGRTLVFAAGELIADRPRAWLEAARSGLVAGAVAAAAAQKRDPQPAANP